MSKHITTALRYPGGKSKALKMILPRIYDDYIKTYGQLREYREPFVGGGSVFLAIKQDLHGKIRYRINDLNPNLYCFWKLAKEDPDALISEVIKVKESIPDGKTLYQCFNKNYIARTDLQKALKFFIRNRITFSGNTDSGGYSREAFEKRFTNSSINRIKDISPLLKDVEITNTDYSKLLNNRGKGIFIYLDPPYYSAMSSELYGKNGDLHKTFDHERFAKTVKHCKHNWLITYDDCSEVRSLFDFPDANIYEWKLQYGVNNNGDHKSKMGNELFISNYSIKSLEKINQWSSWSLYYNSIDYDNFSCYID